MIHRKISILNIFILFFFIVGCSNSKNRDYIIIIQTDKESGCSYEWGFNNLKEIPYNPWNIADDDSMYLTPPYGGQLYKISGSLFKAINPRFIANVYGVTKSEGKLCGCGEQKEFQLIAFEHSFSPSEEEPLTSLNVPNKWEYYINDNLTWRYSRVLVSALMLQAFERVEYIKKDMIRIYTRDISKSIIDDNSTLYLLNNKEITRKIFEAINPVFIRSLKRITNQIELSKHSINKEIKEIVTIELFSYEEFASNRILECPECDAYIVDNVLVDRNIYDALRNMFFRKILIISENEKEAFKPYRKLFSNKNFDGWGKRVYIISL